MSNPDRNERLRGALWGMFVGDALAMPAHWYYDVAALRRDYGILNDYQDPKPYHPDSILSLASTGGPGRGSNDGDVIGSVILHGKKHLWGQPNWHYHQGLRSGDNTLNLLCVRVLLRTVNEAGCYNSADFLREYVSFMTTPAVTTTPTPNPIIGSSSPTTRTVFRPNDVQGRKTMTPHRSAAWLPCRQS